MTTRSAMRYTRPTHPAIFTSCNRVHHVALESSGANTSPAISSQMKEITKYTLPESNPTDHRAIDDMASTVA